MPDSVPTPAPKPLVKSKTFWFNIVTAAVSILVTIQNSELVVDNPQIVAILGLVVGVGNVILRLLSGTPVSGLVKPKK